MGKNAKSFFQDPKDYFGRHPRTLDAGRVQLPLEWRTKDSPDEFALVLWPAVAPKYLLVLPPSGLALFQTRMSGDRFGDKLHEDSKREVFSRMGSKILDSSGRLALIDDAFSMLDIKDKVILVGRMDTFEIWKPEALEDYEKDRDRDKIQARVVQMLNPPQTSTTPAAQPTEALP